MNTWMLPEGINEAGPKQAIQIETLRRSSLDRMASWGYRLIMPPMAEFTDSLLTGVGAELDLQTLKVTDQLSGRQLGIRADMTPQAARLDARHGQGVNRLCYCGSTLQAKPEKPGDSRAPIQIGAELFGHGSLAADLEVIQLLLSLMDPLQTPQLTLDVGHVAVFASLMEQIPATKQREVEQALATKDQTLLGAMQLPHDVHQKAATLMGAQGSVDCLNDLRRAFPALQTVFDDCQAVSDAIGSHINVHFDFAEGRGAHYHTGLVFSLYAKDQPTALARGGRYDSVGADFGSTRPATGFSADLRLWQDYQRDCDSPAPISAPADNDPALAEFISRLRAEGEIIMTDLAGDAAACSRRLIKQNHQWTIENT